MPVCVLSVLTDELDDRGQEIRTAMGTWIMCVCVYVCVCVCVCVCMRVCRLCHACEWHIEHREKKRWRD